MPKKTVLVVDDESSNIDILVDLLGDTYDVEVANNGGEALRLAASSRPDLILLDILMPGLSGLEVCRLLKADEATRPIPVIFVTIKDELKDELEGLEVGASDYIHKPFHPAIVRARVRTHLALADQRLALEGMVRERTTELSQALEALKEANSAKDAFLDNISHELRTPLNGIIGMTHILLEKEDNPEFREYLRMTHSAANRLLRVLEQMMDLSRIRSSAALPFPRRKFRLQDELDELLKDCREQAKAKGLSFDWAMDDDLPASFEGSPDRLVQALRILLENALRYTRQGSIQVVVSATEECLVPVMSEAKGEIALLFQVRDTGTGIPDDRQERIFEAFAVGEPHLTKELAGAGLGLALAKALTEKMGGRIWLRSRMGKGSTFSLAVPLAPCPDANMDTDQQD